MRQYTDTLSTVVNKRPTSNKHASRANAFFEVAGTLANQSYGITAVPIKTLQMLVSTYTAVYVDSSTPQRLLHLSQACLAGGLIALNITIYLRNEECLVVAVSFCQAALICENLYKGIMLTGWGASEFNRKLKTSETQSPVASPSSSPGSSPRDEDFQSEIIINMPKK